MMGCQSNKSNSHEGHNHEGHSCMEVNGGATEEHEHENEEDHSSHAITRTCWSSGAELFVEFHPLVVGQITSFMAHFTRMSDYKPYKTGKLTVSLIKNKKGIRQTIDTPARPGIFIPSLQPKETGKHTLLFDFTNEDGITEHFEIPNIEVYANEQLSAKAIDHTENGQLVKFSKEQACIVDFRTKKVIKKPFQQVIKTTGELIPSNKGYIKLIAQSSGIIHFISNEIIPGKIVKPGQPLFLISGKGLSQNNITSRYVKAKTEYDKAKTNYERAQKLHTNQIISEKDFLDYKTQFKQAQISFQLIDKNYSLKGLKIKASTNGFISDILVSQGQYVEQGQLLGTINNNKSLVLRADLYPKEIPMITKIASANFKLPNSEKIFNTDQLQGKLLAYGKNLNKSDYTSPVFFQIKKQPQLYSGTFVEVFLMTQTQQQVVAIPKTALLEEQGLYYVFVQHDGESYQKRYVKTGVDNGKEIEITNGLNQNEHIITIGCNFVRLASLSGSLPSHSHGH